MNAMNNDNRFQRLIQRMHFGHDGLALPSMLILDFGFLIGTVVYSLYLQTDVINPFGILVAFTSIFVFAKIYLLHIEDEFKLEVHQGFLMGSLKTSTGAGIIWSICYLSANTRVHELELSFWMLLSVPFLDLGIRNICNSIFLSRRSKKRQEQEAGNEQKELEEETTTWWERVEAERKSKAAIEADLLSDLNSYLSET